jgi:hypothetical protein
VEKVTDEKDQRRFLYRPTFDLLSFLGVSKIEDLPEYEKVKAEFEQATVEKVDPAIPEADPNEQPPEAVEDNQN